MSEEKRESSPIGKGHAAAMARMGLAEIRAIFYQESKLAQPDDLGVYGHATPVEVTEARRPEEPAHEPEPESGSILNDKLKEASDKVKEADAREPEGRDSQEMERE